MNRVLCRWIGEQVKGEKRSWKGVGDEMLLTGQAQRWKAWLPSVGMILRYSMGRRMGVIAGLVMSRRKSDIMRSWDRSLLVTKKMYMLLMPTLTLAVVLVQGYGKVLH